MANDPNRDLLPVREEYKKGAGDRIDHQILSKLSRCELEDKFLRLLDEQTSLKRLANFQEEKIKRLGTKLLRLINDKKNGRKNSEQNKETEDLHLRIIELEHENYALKDKNTVLKQQVATHSSHLSVYRSPVRSAHTSPLMSIRQSSQPVQNEVAYESSKKNDSSDVQLQEAENHIKKLNKEIHALHNKIDYLQQDLEKSNLDHRKTKVTENIELIRLQRSLKHQAMQIATLQAQVKNSEHNQKKLKDELVKAHKENEEALQLIAAKQSEILNLGSKLEEKNLNRLEEDELRQRINDLKLERDLLKERSDFLMQTITAKSEETEKVNELKKLLNEEKLKTEELEKDLEAAKKAAEETKEVNELKKLLNEEKLKTEELEKDLEAAKKAVEETKRINSVSVSPSVKVSKSQNVPSNTTATIEKVELGKVTEGPGEDELSACLETPVNSPEEIMSNKSGKNTSLKTVYDHTERQKSKDGIGVSKISQIDGQILADKLKLERELQYMRDMLRSQTARCEAQQEEIARLMTELRVSDAKCNDTLQKLDLHLRIFQELESRTQQQCKPEISEPKAADINQDISKTTTCETEKNDRKTSANQEIKARVPSASKNNVLLVPSIKNVPRAPSPREILLSAKSIILDKRDLISSEVGSKRHSGGQPKKRFVDQVFLDSSDEEVNELPFHKESFIKKLEELEVKKNTAEAAKDVDNFSISKSAVSHRIHESPSSLSSKFPSNSSLSIREPIGKSKGAGNRKPSGEVSQQEEKVIISIMTFKVNPASSLGTNDNIQLLFVDFSFLDVYGEETETPESLPKPRTPEEMCEFNFSKAISLNDSKLRILRSLANKPDIDLVVFKVITDSEDFDQANEIDCEEVGVAVVTVKQFLDHFNKGSLVIPVKNVSDTKEVVGALTVKFDVPGIKRKTSRSAGKVRWIPRMNSLSPARENEGPLTNFMSRKPLTNKMCRGGRKSSRRKVFKIRKESDGFGTESDCPHKFFSRVRFVKPAGGVRRSYDAMVKRQKQYTVPFRRKTPHHRFRSEKKEQKLKLSNFLKKRSAVESNFTDTPGGEILGESTESPLRDFRRTPDNSSVSAFQQPNPFSVGGDNPPNNPYLDVSYPSPPNTIFKSPNKPKIYESPFGSKSNLFSNPVWGKNQVLESSSESSSETVPHDLVKLKQVLEEVEKMLKEEDEEPSVHGEKGQKKKPQSGTNSSKTLEDDLKDEIQEAVPLLNKIAQDLLQEVKNGKASPSSEKNSSVTSKKKTTDTSESEKSKKKEKGSSNSKSSETSKKNGAESSNSKSSQSSKKSTTKSSKKDSVSSQKSSRVIHTSSGPCSVDGTWSSQVLGTELGITIMPNMLLKVSVTPATQDTTINHKWSVQGLTLSKQGGPLILAAIYPQSRKIASFIGQCKTSMGQDLIFGSWMIFHHAPRIGDLWKALDVKMDVLKRVSADKKQIKQEKQEQKDRLTAEKKGGNEKLKGEKKGPKDKLKGDKKNQRQKEKMNGETNKS